MAIYDEHPEALYVLESFIKSVAQQDQLLLVLHALDALDAARRWYAAELQGGTFRPRLSDPRANDLFVRLRAAGAFLLGRPTSDLDDRTEQRQDPITVETLVRCFRQLEKSARLWTGEGGRRGYLTYIDEHLPG